MINYKPTYVLGFGIITTVTMLFYYFLAPLCLPRFFEESQWTVAREISTILTNVTLITIFNYYYSTFIGNHLTTQPQLSKFIIMTISIGLFPILFSVFIRERALNKQHVAIAEAINDKRQTIPVVTTQPIITSIQLSSPSSNDQLNIALEQLLFIKSEGNYCKISYIEEQIIQTKLLRTTLKKVEEELKLHHSIIRCHRSYIINKQHIKTVSGNARSYNIHLYQAAITIPVSRNFDKTLLY